MALVSAAGVPIMPPSPTPRKLAKKRKLLKRHVDQSDRRVVIAEITPAGARLARKATDSLKAVHFGLNGDLSEEAACEVAAVLSQIR